MDTPISPQALWLDETDSTNSYLMGLLQAQPDLPSLYSVAALDQTAGRGQRGNTWATTRGLNLTFSFVLRPARLEANAQYAVSEYASLGLIKTIARYLPLTDQAKLSIKWPNDIYYEGRKLAGILIEHSITAGLIDYSIIGIGLNLNEELFPDHLPNPISLKQITGKTYDLAEVHAGLMKRYKFMREELHLGRYAEVHRAYMRRLYRREGVHAYHDASGAFVASIRDVLPSGHLVLERIDGSLSTYAFKEVVFDAD